MFGRLSCGDSGTTFLYDGKIEGLALDTCHLAEHQRLTFGDPEIEPEALPFLTCARQHVGHLVSRELEDPDARSSGIFIEILIFLVN